MTRFPLRPSPSWPAADAERYRAAGLWTGETLGGLLADRASRFARRTAVVGSDGTRWTYAELDERATALAAGFAALGVAPGDRVVVQLPNISPYVEVLFGLWRAGALPVFALPAHRRTEMVAFAAASEAVAIVAVDRHAGFDHGALAAEVADAVPSVAHVILAGELDALRGVGGSASVPEPPPASAVAFLQLSGGTTGTPKLIPRTHDDYLYSVRASAEICGLSPESVYLCALPAAHNFPMSSPGLLGVLHAGGTIVLAPSPDPATCFEAIARERVTITALVPPLLLAWLDARRPQHDLSSLALLQVGGAKLTPEVARRVGPVLGCRLQQVFGMAEGLVSYTRAEDPEELVVGTQGRPISAAFDELRVVDDDGRDVVEGAPGQLLTRGPYTIRGYYDDADPGSFTADGFYRTGDVVRRLASGHLVVEGRVKDQINRGGEKIAPDEVEDHLLAHPAVHDAAVVGVPDERLGERSCAVLVARDGAAAPTAAEVRRFLRDRGVAAFKLPDRVEVVVAFPQTGVGKVSRRDLRAAVAASLTPVKEPA